MDFHGSKQLITLEGGLAKKKHEPTNPNAGLHSGEIIIGASGSLTLRSGGRPPAASQIAKHAELMVEETEAAKSQAKIYMQRCKEIEEKYDALDQRYSYEQKENCSLKAQLDESAKVAQEFVEQIQYVEMLQQALRENQAVLKQMVEEGGARTNKIDDSLQRKLATLEDLQDNHKSIFERQKKLEILEKENSIHVLRGQELEFELKHATEAASRLGEECAELKVQLNRHLSSINHMQISMNDKMAEIEELRQNLEELRREEQLWKESSERQAKEFEGKLETFQVRMDAKQLEIEQAYENQKSMQASHEKECEDLRMEEGRQRERAERNRVAYFACKVMWKASRCVLKNKLGSLEATKAEVMDLERSLHEEHDRAKEARAMFEERIASMELEKGSVYRDLSVRNEQELEKIRDCYVVELEDQKRKFELAMQQKDVELKDLRIALEVLGQKQNAEPPTKEVDPPTKPSLREKPSELVFKTSRQDGTLPREKREKKEGIVGKPLVSSANHSKSYARRGMQSAFHKLQKRTMFSNLKKPLRDEEKRTSNSNKENVFDF